MTYDDGQLSGVDIHGPHQLLREQLLGIMEVLSYNDHLCRG